MPGANSSEEIYEMQPLATNDTTRHPEPDSFFFRGEEIGTRAEDTTWPDNTTKSVTFTEPLTTAEISPLASPMEEPRGSGDTAEMDLYISVPDPSTASASTTTPEADTSETAQPLAADENTTTTLATDENTTIAKTSESGGTSCPPENKRTSEMIESEDTYCAPSTSTSATGPQLYCPATTDEDQISRVNESEDTYIASPPTGSEDDQTPKPITIGEREQRIRDREDLSYAQALSRRLDAPMKTTTSAAGQSQERKSKTARYCSWGMVKQMLKKHFGERTLEADKIPIVIKTALPSEVCKDRFPGRIIVARLDVYPEATYEEFSILAVQAFRDQHPNRRAMLEGLRVNDLLIQNLDRKKFTNTYRALDRDNFSGSLAGYWRTTKNKMLPLQVQVVFVVPPVKNMTVSPSEQADATGGSRGAGLRREQRTRNGIREEQGEGAVASTSG
ncbi:MAG: hypothetical protein Q9218_002392 [Villophora microphyllina]